MIGTKSRFMWRNLLGKLKLFIRKPHFILFYIGRAYKYANTKNFDAFIISYPKSGRTWLQKLLIEAIQLEYNVEIPSSDVSETHKYTDQFPTMLSTHAGSSWEEKVKNSEDIKVDDWHKYAHSKCILLVRDPRDVLVSQYHHIRNRSNFPQFPKEELISNPNVGLSKMINFVNKWVNYSNQYNENCHLLTYEEMKADTTGVLKGVFNFLHIKMSDESIATAIQNSSLKRMQQNESSQNTPWSYTNNVTDQNSFQSRKGIVGDYVNFFDEIEIEEMNSMIEAYLCADLNQYKY